MLSVVSDNHENSQIQRISYTQLGLNDAENSLILDTTPQDQFIRATAKYQLCVDHMEELDKSIRPSLIKYMKGPFDLSIYNHGKDIASSMLIFELQPIKTDEELEKSPNGIITEAPRDLTSRALAVLPFIDVFRKQIELEAKRAKRFIESSKVTNIADAQAEKDRETALFLTKGFMNILRPQSEKQAPEIITGKAAILDIISPSLSANSDFYDALWAQMQEFFEPSFRYIGEEHALGKVSLESPMPFI